MIHATPEQQKTYRLAARFLGVFQQMVQFTEEEAPDDVVAQLSVNQLRTLNLIYRHPGISQKELAEQLDVTQASISIWIKQMQDANLVHKHPYEEDARVMCLYLGPVGQKLVETFERNQTDAIAKLLVGLPLNEQEFVVEALERALEQHQRTLPAAPAEEAQQPDPNTVDPFRSST